MSYLFSTDNESPITLAVEKDKDNNFAWLSVYKYNASDTVKDLSTIYWCRGIFDNTGEVVICKVGSIADTFLNILYSLSGIGIHNIFFHLA